MGSPFTWIFSRRKQNNDFLVELQSSINLLSGENKKILEDFFDYTPELDDLLEKEGKEEFLEISRRSDAERAAEGLFDDRHGGNDRVFVRNRRVRRSRRCRCAFPTTPASCSASPSVFSAMWYLCFHD